MERRVAARISQSIALLGLGSALVVYVLASEPQANPLGYDPLTNKKYVHELQQFGGKANVATAEFMQWFDSLWHGKTLAATLAVLSLVTAWLFWWFATLPKLETQSKA